MPPPLDNLQAEQLVIAYQGASEPQRSELFREIASVVIPLVKSQIVRTRWDICLAETPDDLTHEIIVRLPKILDGWRPGRGSTFVSYLLSSVFNDFRHRYAKRQRRSRYHGDWPVDADGNEADIADTNTKKLNGHQTTLEARGREFEQLMFRIPNELAARVDLEFSGLVHFLATRYLGRADNGEALFLTELRKEVAAFPAASSLNTEQIDSLVRMVLIAVRSRLYVLHSADGVEQSVTLKKLDHRLWPLMLAFDSRAETGRLLASLAGVFGGVPVRGKWFRQG